MKAYGAGMPVTGGAACSCALMEADEPPIENWFPLFFLLLETGSDLKMFGTPLGLEKNGLDSLLGGAILTFDSLTVSLRKRLPSSGVTLFLVLIGEGGGAKEPVKGLFYFSLGSASMVRP